jgi:hypothetical protein
MSAANNAPVATKRPLQIALRVLWIMLAVLLLFFFIGGIPYRFEALAQVCMQPPCTLNALEAS